MSNMSLKMVGVFRVNYKNALNNRQRYTSKKFATKTKAKEAERKFLNELEKNSNLPSKMTLGELWDKYLEFQCDKVRINARRSYHYAEQSIKLLFNLSVLNLIWLTMISGKNIYQALLQ